MTTVAVPDTSRRGCPSSHAGTTLQQLAALILPCARMIAICCRTDSSGFIADTAPAAHPYDPSATVSSYSRPTTESGKRTPNPSQHAAILSPAPFAGLPIGGKGHSRHLPCQPPTGRKETICCRTRTPSALPRCRCPSQDSHATDPLMRVTCHHFRRPQGCGTASGLRLKVDDLVVYSKTQCYFDKQQETSCPQIRGTP